MNKTRAIVLKTTLIRESDVLLVALSEQHGKIQLLARGARRSRKRFLGGIDVFDAGNFELTRKADSSMSYAVEQFVPGIRWKQLSSSLDALVCGAFCVELAEIFCGVDDESSGALFKPLFAALRAIDEHSEPATQIAAGAYFALLLLQHAGLDAAEGLEGKNTTWFTQMLEQQQPIVPNDSQLTAALIPLLSFIEEHGNQQLRSGKQFLQLVRQQSR